MFQFWYEKFISRFIPLLVFASVFTIIFYAFYTTISVPQPDKAPFIQDIREEANKEDSKHKVTLEKPHLSDNEIKNWISKAVSEALFFNKKSYSKVAKNIKPYFTDAGFQKFQDYLIASGIAENIRVNEYDMSIYIEKPPLFLNSSVINGTFKWLYQMPVVISFFPTGKKNIAKESGKFINRKLTLRLQITRAKVDGNPDIIQIEDWTAIGSQ